GLYPQTRYLAHHLAVPLGEFERRHVLGELDGGISGQHVLQKFDPGFPDAGFTVRQPGQVWPGRLGQRAKYRLAVRQRDAADEVDDGMLAAVGHGLTPLPVRRYGRYFGDHIFALIAGSISSSARLVRPSFTACRAVARATAIETSRRAVTGGSRLPA